MLTPRIRKPPTTTPTDRDKARLARKLRIIKAYKNKFGGNDEDTKLIRADLEKRCGIYRNPYFPKCGGKHLAHVAGLKAVFLHIKHRTEAIMDQVQLTPEDE